MSWNAGRYRVFTNYWNQAACPGTQCVTMDDVTGNFGVTQMTANCSQVASYPAIYYGCHYGNCSAGTNLPIQLSALSCVTSNWTITTTASGVWDAAYDIWFCRGGAGSCTGGYDGAEVMIWMDYQGASPLGGQVASNVNIGGRTWNVWEGTINSTTTWNVISYVATTKFTTASNLNLLSFFNDAVSRGYMQTSWYLHAVEAGIEISRGGVPFTSSNFAVTVNGTCGTPVPTATPTATVCNLLFNGLNSAAQNGTWAGGNATRTFIAGSSAPAGASTEGTTLMRVAAGPTTAAWNNGLFNLSGFSPDPFSGFSQLTLDLYVDAAVTAQWGSYHQLSLIGDASGYSLYSVPLSSNNPSLAFGPQHLTFNLDYPASINSSMFLSNLFFVLNAQSPVTTGNFYVDNIRLIAPCGLPTATPTPCQVLFNTADSLTANGNWTGTNATRTIVTSAPAGAIVQGTGALRAQVTTSGTFNTELFNLDSFAPGNWYGVTRLQANVYVDPSLVAGQAYNQLLLYGDSYPTTYFQPISSTQAALVAGANTLVWTIDFKEPGTGNPGGITAGMPITKLNFVWNSGPLATNVGNFYVDNILMLRDGCLPTPTNTATFTPTRTFTLTLSPTPAVTNTSTVTSTPTLTRTSTPAPNTATSTLTPTASATRTSSSTPTATPSATPTRTASSTNTPPASTATSTLTLTRTNTPPPSTFTATSTGTATRTPSATGTSTSTVTLTSTRTASPTPTDTGASTATSTSTRTLTSTPLPPTSTSTQTASTTRTSSSTLTATPSASPTRTSTPVAPTFTVTQTSTRTASPTPTDTGAPTATSTSTTTLSSTATRTSTSVPTQTNTATLTATLTISPTATDTGAPTATRTSTLASTPTSSPTATASLSMTPTRTASPTATLPPTQTSTATSASTATASSTPTLSATASATSTLTVSPTPSNTPSRTATQTSTSSRTSTPTDTPSFTPTTPATPTETFTPTVEPGSTPIVFPNPIVSGTVQVLPQSYNNTSNITVQIYTSGGMRLVLEKSFQGIPAGQTVTIDLLDGTGQPLANGVYYLYVTTKKDRKSSTLVITR